ncbi:MAG: hypothetical protein EBU66_12525 [Bacteroidetes bacterium]|nr:hypothetical protein [Bacteroidota bacterium]
MKRRTAIVSLIAIMLLTCVATNTRLISSIGKYVVQIDLITDENGESPSTNVGFYIEDWAGRYNGYDMYGVGTEVTKEEYSTYDIPKKADAACHSFWAGMGETVYLVQKNNTVEMYSRKEYEEGDVTKYKKVKTVKLK